MGVKMKLHSPARVFEVGLGKTIKMKDCAHVELAPDEQVTFVTASGGEYDVARKSWGFYATPSLNGRLREFGLRALLIRNRLKRYFVVLVEKEKESLFKKYLREEGLRIVCWLDSQEKLERLEGKAHAQ